MGLNGQDRGREKQTFTEALLEVVLTKMERSQDGEEH